MGSHFANGHDAFDFIDRVIDLFHHPHQEQPASPPVENHPANKQFEKALGALEQAIAKHQQGQGAGLGWQKGLKHEDQKTKELREQKIHEAVRRDVEAAHVRLQTSISRQELDLLHDYLKKVSQVFGSGEESHEVLPRCQAAMLKRIHYETGVLALEAMDDLLASQNEIWPRPAPRHQNL